MDTPSTSSAIGEIAGHPRSPSREVLVTGSLMLAALVGSLASSWLIAILFPDRPRPRDLMFEVLPRVDAFEYVTDIAVFSAILLLLVYAVRHRRAEIPRMLKVFALMYLFRAAIMLLTPLASAHGNEALYGAVPAIQNGMYPSGHAAAVTLCFLLVAPSRTDLRRIMLVLLFVEVASLLLSRGHYSIDIVGGLLLSYFVYHEYTRGTAFSWLKTSRE